MTTQPQRRRPRTRRPVRQNLRRQPARTPRTGANLFIGAVILLIALLLFQAEPALTTIAVVLIGAACLAAAHWPRTRALAAIPTTLAAFQELTPVGFEHAIARLVTASGAHHAEVIGGANDRGADVIATIRRYRYFLIRQDRRILIQCKRYVGHPVGSEHVQIVNGTYRHIHRCHLALIVTTSNFTAAALQTKELIGGEIRLVDGRQLSAWANGGTPPWR